MNADAARSRIRFFLDENLSRRLATLARARGLDVTSAQELGRHGISDEAQLAYAAAEGRILVTKDIEDLSRISEDFRRRGRPHAGMLLVPWRVDRSDFGRFLAALTFYVRNHPEPMAPYQIEWLRRP